MTDDEIRDAITYNKTRGLFGMPLAADEFALLVEAWQHEHGLRTDGMYGPATQAQVVEHLAQIRRPIIFAVPATHADVVDYYGDPSREPREKGQANQSWFMANIVECHGSTALPGVPAHWYVQVHHRARDFFRAGLEAAARFCPGYEIQRVGGFNYRVRGGNPEALSLHSSGAAIDIDAATNGAKRFARGKKPEPFSQAWKELWPKGLPEAFVVAMKSVGLVWGGDFESYVDCMHFQAAGPSA